MINKIILFSIKHKIVILMLTLALIIGGIYSMMRVHIDAVPDITNNQVQVITTSPNLGTEDIEKYVTYKVELAVANLPGVVEIRSISRFGLSVVTIVFEDDMGTYLPRQLVNEVLTEIKEQIPKDLGEPFMGPITTGLGEIYQYTLEVQPGYEDKYDDMELRTIQDWIVKRQMAMVPGVVEVNSFGGRKKQYEIAVNPDKLRSMGVTISDIFEAINKNNQNTGGAYIEKNHQANFIRGEGLMRSVEDIKNTLVKNIDGQPILIRDVATVKFGSFVKYGGFIKDGKGEAVGGIVMMLKGANSNDVIKAVKVRMAEIEKSLPPGIKIKPFLDRSKLIKSTTTTVAENLIFGAIIVIFVLILFLGNIRGGLIVASVIPLAMLFAFIMMDIFGVWANLMSMGALDFGILIDGAVIIVESMIFYLHRKEFVGKILPQEKKDEIAYNAASKMLNAAFFGQLIILVVFVPVLALHGIEGKMFRPMALTFGFAILGVMLLSLTYIPVMAALFLNPPKTERLTIGDKIINKIKALYGRVLSYALAHTRVVISSALVAFIATVILFNKRGAEFIPKLDEGDFAFHAFFKPGTALSEVEDMTDKILKRIKTEYGDEIESIQGRIGVADVPTDPMPMDMVDIFVILKPQKYWTKVKNKKELIAGVKDILSGFPGINFEFSQPIEMRFNELLTGVREDIAIKIYGDDMDVLAQKAKEIQTLISGIEGIEGIKTEATRGLPQITVRYNRHKTARYGVDIDYLNTIISTAFSGGVAGKIFEGEKMFDLVIRLDEKHRRNIDDIRNLFVTMKNGNQVPLKELAEINYQPGPMQISRDNTHRRVYVGINVEDRDIKTLVNEIKDVLDEKLTLPAGYYLRYGGAFENLERATKKLAILVPLSLLLIFMLVFFAIKSVKQTLMIYLAIPFAAIGGVLALYLRDMPFSISAGVGFIVLFGVAVLNGLVLINGFNQYKKQSKDDLITIIKTVSLRRLRPIFLTASTDILGFLPMAISTSAGAEVQRPVATVVIGGMISATLLTLVVLPVLYSKLERTNFNLKNLGRKPVMIISFILVTIVSIIPSKAQEVHFNMLQAVDTALLKYPELKTKKLLVQKQRALQKGFYDFGQLTVFTGKEETGKGAPGIYNIAGLQIDGIDLLGAGKRKKVAGASLDIAGASLYNTRQEVAQKVSLLWLDAWYLKKYYLLLSQIGEVYREFARSVRLRYKTGMSPAMDTLSVYLEYRQLENEMNMTAGEYAIAKSKLNVYLMQSGDFEIDTAIVIPDVEDDTLALNTGLLDFYKYNIVLQQAEVEKMKTYFYPKFNIAYKLQAVDGDYGYNAWEIGVALPLSYNYYKSRLKAENIDVEIAANVLSGQKWKFNSFLHQLELKRKALSKTLDFYKNHALPSAKQQLEAVALAYQKGDVDYEKYLLSLRKALSLQKEFLSTQKQWLEIVIGINYLTVGY